MAGDNPGMPSGGDNAAVNMAHEIETSVKKGNYDSASQRFSQEIQRYSGQQKQVFVRDVLQQLQSKGYHLTEIEIVGENALSSAPQGTHKTARAGAPIELRPWMPGYGKATAPTEQYQAPYRGAQPPQTVSRNELSPPPAAPTEQYRAPYRGAQPPQTVYRSELSPPPGKQVAPGEQHLSNNNSIAAQTQQADRIAQGALQLKRQGAGTKKIEDHIRKETVQIYKEHPDWMYGTTRGSFIPELNQKLKQEHIWSEQHAPHHPSVRHAEHVQTHKQEVAHHRLVHAHPLLKGKEQLKLEHEGKIKEYTIPKNPKHPRAAIPLHSIAAETLPPKYRTQAHIKERTEELAHLNHLPAGSYFRPGDQLWITTPKYYGKSAAKEPVIPPAEVSKAAPKRYTYEAPFTPAKPAEALKTQDPAGKSDAVLHQFLGEADKNKANAQLTLDERKGLEGAIKDADGLKSKGAEQQQIETRSNFLKAFVAASNRDTFKKEAVGATQWICSHDASFFDRNYDFKTGLMAAGIDPDYFGSDNESQNMLQELGFFPF